MAASPRSLRLAHPESELDRALRECRDERACEDNEALRLCRVMRESVGAELLRQAGRVHRHFRRAPHLRAVWEQKILSGEASLDEVLAAIGG